MCELAVKGKHYGNAVENIGKPYSYKIIFKYTSLIGKYIRLTVKHIVLPPVGMELALKVHNKHLTY